MRCFYAQKEADKMEYPKMTKEKYRAKLIEKAELLAELAETPSMAVTKDAVINVLRLDFELCRELYKLDNDIR